MGSVADDIGPETAVRPPARNPAAVPSTTAREPEPRAAAPAPRTSAAVVTERRYRQTIHRADRMYITQVHADVPKLAGRRLTLFGDCDRRWTDRLGRNLDNDFPR